MTKDTTPADLVWDTAWDWARREQGLDEAGRMEVGLWLRVDPRHRKAYEQACHLWLLAGLVPPKNDVPIPGCEGPEEG